MNCQKMRIYKYIYNNIIVAVVVGTLIMWITT